MSDGHSDSASLRLDLMRSQQAVQRHWEELREEAANREPRPWEVSAATRRGKVTVALVDESHYGSLGPVPEKLEKAVAWLSKKLDAVPAELRRSAKLEIESVGGYEGEHHVEVRITYERPETDAEWAARKADVERRAALWQKRREEADRAEYERLRGKFGAAS